MLAAGIFILPSEDILTFKIQAEVESLYLSLALSAALIIAAAPFAISVAICNGHNVQSKAVVFVSVC